MDQARMNESHSPGSGLRRREAACPVANGDTSLVAPGCPLSEKADSFDFWSADYQLDPAEALRWARDAMPVFYSPQLDYWVVTRYEDVKAVFRDNILFSPSIVLDPMRPPFPEAREILRKYGFAMQRTMVNEDEPDHMNRRRLLLDSFAPERLATFEPKIRALTRSFVDRFVDRGEADLVREMLWEIPMRVALDFLGVKGEDIPRLREYCQANLRGASGNITLEQEMAAAESRGQFWRDANAILDRMMAEPDGDGWMYFSIRMHREHPDIVPLSYLRSMIMAILAAAHETTSNAASNAFRMLLSDRRAWDEICVNPHLIPNAVEECLRLMSSIIAFRRKATAATNIGGVAIPEGARLLLVMVSANHDERHFSDPDRLDLYRANASEHLSFGYGAHQCMGKNIARMEIRIFLEELSKRLPHMALRTMHPIIANPSIRGLESLVVAWDPAQNPERADAGLLGRHEPFGIGPPTREALNRKMRVVRVDPLAANVTGLVLEPVAPGPLPPWTAGSHIDLVGGGFDRKYSLCGEAGDKGFVVAVARDEAGRGGSRHFGQQVTAGDILHVRGPRSAFALDEEAEDYCLIAGGIGITPIIAMADRLRSLGKPFALHYAGRSRQQMPFLDRLARDHGTALHLYPGDEDKRMDLAAVCGAPSCASRIYACGPASMLAELADLARDWPVNRLHFEHFSSAGASDEAVGRGFTAELRDSNLTVEVPADKSLLDVLESIGIDVACDCREGLCGSCEVAVLSGAVDHRDRVLARGERDANRKIISCCSRAAGERIVLAI